MNFISNIYITIAIISLFIGIYIYLYTNDKKLKRMFLFFTLAGFYWAFTGFLLRSATSFDQAYLFQKIGGLWPFCIAVFVHFTLFYTNREKIQKNKFLYYLMLYIPAAIFSIIEITTDQLGMVTKSSLGFWTSTVPDENIFYLMSTAWSWIFPTLAIFLLAHYFLTRKDSKEKKQTLYVLLGISTPVVLSTVTETILPILSLPTIKMTVIGFGLGLIFIGIAIIKYDLFWITESKVAEKIYPILPDMLMVINKDKKIQMVNKELQKNLGYNKKQLIGQKADILFESDKSFESTFNFEKINNLDTQMITKNKEKIPVQISTKRLTDRNNEQNGLIIVARDITEIKTSEGKLKSYVEKLEKNELAMISILEDLKISEKNMNNLNKNLEQKVKERSNEIEKLLKQKDEFIDQLSHDLKNPLTPLTTLLPIIKKNIKDEKTVELVDVAIRNTKYIKNLVKNTLHLARLNSPNTELNYEEFNLLDEITEIVEKNRYTIQNSKIILDLDLSQNINIEADKLKIEELFDNLISNSLKYSTEKSIVKIKADEKDDFVKVSISDNGIGLKKEQIDHIFDEFYKTDESRSDYHSTGLGLPICKKIVEKHGGKIWAESDGPGKGSTFNFTIKKTSKNSGSRFK